MFFVGTAAADERVNSSPKGQDTLRVLDAHRVAWLNLTGSGNETAAHLLGKPHYPDVVRLYGTATIYHPSDVAES